MLRPTRYHGFAGGASPVGTSPPGAILLQPRGDSRQREPDEPSDLEVQHSLRDQPFCRRAADLQRPAQLGVVDPALPVSLSRGLALVSHVIPSASSLLPTRTSPGPWWHFTPSLSWAGRVRPCTVGSGGVARPRKPDCPPRRARCPRPRP